METTQPGTEREKEKRRKKKQNLFGAFTKQAVAKANGKWNWKHENNKNENKYKKKQQQHIQRDTHTHGHMTKNYVKTQSILLFVCPNTFELSILLWMHAQRTIILKLFVFFCFVFLFLLLFASRFIFIYIFYSFFFISLHNSSFSWRTIQFIPIQWPFSFGIFNTGICGTIFRLSILYNKAFHWVVGFSDIIWIEDTKCKLLFIAFIQITKWKKKKKIKLLILSQCRRRKKHLIKNFAESERIKWKEQKNKYHYK